jgi:hypothetical protein
MSLKIETVPKMETIDLRVAVLQQAPGTPLPIPNYYRLSIIFNENRRTIDHFDQACRRGPGFKAVPVAGWGAG